eukprot:g1054.t1
MKYGHSRRLYIGYGGNNCTCAFFSLLVLIPSRTPHLQTSQIAPQKKQKTKRNSHEREVIHTVAELCCCCIYVFICAAKTACLFFLAHPHVMGHMCLSGDQVAVPFPTAFPVKKVCVGTSLLGSCLGMSALSLCVCQEYRIVLTSPARDYSVCLRFLACCPFADFPPFPYYLPQEENVPQNMRPGSTACCGGGVVAQSFREPSVAGRKFHVFSGLSERRRTRELWLAPRRGFSRPLSHLHVEAGGRERPRGPLWGRRVVCSGPRHKRGVQALCPLSASSDCCPCCCALVPWKATSLERRGPRPRVHLHL